MIGKPEWFRPRKFGWGLGIRTKEAIFYIAAIIAIVFLLVALPLPHEVKLIGIAVLILIILADTVHIMMKVYSRLDEREQKHQLLAETNASYIGVAVLVLNLAYFIITASFANQEPDPMIVFPILSTLVVMALVKGATLLYVERKG
ncbi:hypothetical protein JXA56_03385 [Candidatus Micrarchaeota archaeon]|nr:hypothetical protein [Candidatus Micrarchaeota archaeon]